MGLQQFDMRLKGYRTINVFNVSSVGGTATAWLANFLNLLPGVTCFHGLREDPFINREMRMNAMEHEELDPAALIFGLKKLGHNQIGCTSIGAVHSAPDDRMREAVKALRGEFLVMLRNPFQRVVSLFTHHYRDILRYPAHDADVFKYIKNNFSLPYVNEEDVTRTYYVDKHPLLRIFTQLTYDIFYTDVANIQRVPLDEHLIYEHVFADREYFKEKVVKLIGLEIEDFDSIAEEQMAKPLNSHSEMKSLSDYDLFHSMPDAFCKIFNTVVDQFGADNLTKLYAYANVPIPEELFRR